jgi:hypothetical protein
MPVDLGLRGAGGEDAADRRVRAGRELFDSEDIAGGKQRIGFLPQLAIFALDAREKQPALDGDRNAQRQDQRDGIHHQAALLEEVQEGYQEIHVAFPRMVKRYQVVVISGRGERSLRGESPPADTFQCRSGVTMPFFTSSAVSAS